MDEATKIKRLKEAEQAGEGGSGCVVLMAVALVALFIVMVAPVVISRQPGRESGPAVAQATTGATRPPSMRLESPINTAVPLPTHLPTNLPTYTPAATYTPPATWTAVPSQTPLPTYTPAATYTPPATWTAVPTNTPMDPNPGAGAVSLPPSPQNGRLELITIFLAGAVFTASLALLVFSIMALVRRPKLQPPLIIEAADVETAAPLPSPYTPAFIRPLPPQERRYRPVAPVKPVQPVLTDGVTSSTSGGGEIVVSVPFDKTRPPTAAEMAYIRARYVELGSVNKVAADCYQGKSPVILDYIRQALEQGGIAYPARRPAVAQRRVVIVQ